jgi:hypothetical protein
MSFFSFKSYQASLPDFTENKNAPPKRRGIFDHSVDPERLPRGDLCVSRSQNAKSAATHRLFILSVFL